MPSTSQFRQVTTLGSSTVLVSETSVTPVPAMANTGTMGQDLLNVIASGSHIGSSGRGSIQPRHHLHSIADEHYTAESSIAYERPVQ